MSKLPVSVFVITKNEALRLGRTLASVQALASEIVVVDSGSTDGTQEIAQQYGANVLYHDWQGYGPQKRFAEEQCTHDWVLNLDADEVLSRELVDEIRAAFSRTEQLATADGYFLLIRDCVPGEEAPRRFAHTTKAVRLYRKSKGRYSDSPVHDRVQFSDPSARLRSFSAPVYHYSVVTIEQAIMKLNRYSTMQAVDMKTRGKEPAWLLLRLYTEIFMAFFKSYIMRADILRGHAGFVNSTTYAFSRFARIAKVWEQRKH